MYEIIFFDESTVPSKESLKSTFGYAYTYFNKLMDISDSFFKDRNFSKRSGWILKVHDKKKALFYIIPMKNEFKVSLAVRDMEYNKFINDVELKNVHENLLSTKKYREGFAIRFKTTDENYETFELLITKLIRLRT